MTDETFELPKDHEVEPPKQQKELVEYLRLVERQCAGCRWRDAQKGNEFFDAYCTNPNADSLANMQGRTIVLLTVGLEDHDERKAAELTLGRCKQRGWRQEKKWWHGTAEEKRNHIKQEFFPMALVLGVLALGIWWYVNFT